MKNGFLRVGAVTPKLRVADIDYNADEIIASVNNADESCALLVFPELCVTGKTCGDLFRQRSFIDAAWEAMYRIADETSEKNVVFIIGLPAYIEGKLLDLAVVIHQGTILGCNVKLTLSEEEARYFSPYEVSGSFYDEYFEDEIAFGQPLYFCERDLFSFSVIFHDDLTAPISDDVDAALAGCHILAVPSAFATTIGSSEKTAPILTAQVFEESPEMLGCCCGGIDRFYVGAAGDVQPCEFVNLSFGNLNEVSFETAYARMRKAFAVPCEEWTCCVHAKEIAAHAGEHLPLPWEETEKIVSNWKCGRPTAVYRKMGIYK